MFNNSIISTSFIKPKCFAVPKIAYASGYSLTKVEQIRNALLDYDNRLNDIKDLGCDDIPWSFKGNARIDGKISRDINNIRLSIIKEGLKPNTDEYEIAFGTKLIEYCMDELGVREFTPNKEDDMRLNALQAIKEQRGNCFEKSLVLLTIFKKAYLKAELIGVIFPKDFARKLGQPSGIIYHTIFQQILPSGKENPYDPTQDVGGDTIVRFYNGYKFTTYKMDDIKVLCRYFRDLGASYSMQKKYVKVFEMYEKALELDPEDATVISNMGRTYFLMKEYQESIAQYQKAIKLDPEDVGSYNNLGNAFLEIGLYKEAFDTFKKGLELDPDYELIRENMLEAKSKLS